MIDPALLGYNFRLAVRNIRRNPVLSALMVAAIGVGTALAARARKKKAMAEAEDKSS